MLCRVLCKNKVFGLSHRQSMGTLLQQYPAISRSTRVAHQCDVGWVSHGCWPGRNIGDVLLVQGRWHDEGGGVIGDARAASKRL